jgi:hypothetical protein
MPEPVEPEFEAAWTHTESVAAMFVGGYVGMAIVFIITTWGPL